MVPNGLAKLRSNAVQVLLCAVFSIDNISINYIIRKTNCTFFFKAPLCTFCF